MATPISIPKGYDRLGSFPLDATNVFTTYAELETYAASPTAYAGQVCAVSGDNTLYMIDSTFQLIPILTSSQGGTEAPVYGGTY